MIKYAVMDFSDVKVFQKFRIQDDDAVYIKLPRAYEAPPKYVFNYDTAPKRRPAEFDEPVLINAYKRFEAFSPRSLINEYCFISDDTECIVDGKDMI